MSGRRSGSAFIVLLLLSTLAVAGALAYQAQQAARSHRATAENVLRDYATFASWEFSRLARRDLNDAEKQWWRHQRTHGLCQAVRQASSPLK